MTSNSEALAGSPPSAREASAPQYRAFMPRAASLVQENLTTLALALSGALAVLMVYALQIKGRTTSLVWDEAVRVRSAKDFGLMLERGDLGQAWAWMHAQVIYPFLYPAAQGVLLALGVQPLTSAIAPSLVAFAMAGILVAMLTRELGGSRGAGFAAASMYWLTPLAVRLAAWGSFEHIGACVFLALGLMLVKLEREQKARYAVAAGCLAATACFLKWDYSVVASGTMGLSIVVAGVWHHRLKAVWLSALSAATFLVIMGGWLAIDWHDKREGLREVIGQGSNYDLPDRNPLFYLEGIFSGQAGLSPVIALLLVAGLVYAAQRCLIRRLPAAALLIPGVALAMYTASDVKHLRYIVPFLGFLAAFASLLFFDGLERLKRVAGERAVFAGGAALACLLAAQALGSNGVSSRFDYLEPRSSADAVLSFIDQHLQRERRSPILLNSTNQINIYDIELRWLEHPRITPRKMIMVNVAPDNDGVKEFLRNVTFTHGGLIIGLDFATTSSLYSPGDMTISALFPDYLAIAKDLEASGQLVAVDKLVLEDGATVVHLWRQPPEFYTTKH